MKTSNIKTILLFIFVVAFSYMLFGRNKVINNNTKIPESSNIKPVNERIAELESRDDLNVAIVAGGCFWCMEGPFEALDGVEEVITGYTGGSIENPTYEQVASGTTKHREAGKIYYNPNKITYEELLDKFWTQLDPTDAGGQFTDRGYQYTTAIYYSTDDEKQIAETQKLELEESGKYKAPIVTEIVPAQEFYPAEEYHQDFYKHSSERYKLYKKGSGREDYINSQESK